MSYEPLGQGLWYFLTSFVGTLGFAILLHAPKRAWLPASLIGAMTYTLYWSLKQLSLDEAASMFLAALFGSLLAQFCAVTGRDDVVNEACAGLNILHTETLGRQKSCVVRVPAETMAAKGLDVDCTSLPLQKVFVALCGHEQELQEHREG